jgi:DNA-binding CsgD family transcriptional regulator
MAKDKITSCTSLKDLLSDQKDYVVEETIKNLKLFAWKNTSWERFLDTNRGVYRLKVWIDLIVRALEGKQNLFLLDAELSGFFRSNSEFELNSICQFYLTFLTTVNDVIIRLPAYMNTKLYKEYLELTEMVFRGFTILSISYNDTMKENMRAKIKELQELYEFTHKVLYYYQLEDPLTQRELEVLKCMMEGNSNRLIAEKLFISEHTVRSHIKKIYLKLNVSSKGQALSKAIRMKIFEGF